MPLFIPGGSTGGGAGIKTRTPTDIFTGATRTAAETARDAGLDAADLAEFNADPNLAIILRIAGADTYQVRRSGSWHDVTNVVRGPQGPGPTNQQVTTAVQAGVKAYARLGGPVVPEGEIAAAITRDTELAAVRQALESALATHAANNTHLTAQQRADIARSIVGVSITGSGASRTITFTRAGGADPLTLPIPDTGDGGGSGGGGSSGTDDHLVATGSSYSATSQILTLALSDGTTVQIDMRDVVTQNEMAATLASYARLDGATFTGAVKGVAPVSNLDFATKAYVDGRDPASEPIVVGTLGQPNLETTDVTESGILNAAGDTTSRLQLEVGAGQLESGEVNILWDVTADAHSLPAGAVYNATTGILTLPDGVWLIEAVLKTLAMQTTTQAATTTTILNMSAALYEDDELRYEEEGFFWGRLQNHPTLSVTGSLVVPVGSTGTVQVRANLRGDPTRAAVIENAHMEVIRIGDSGQTPEQAQHIRAGWSADTMIADAELSATSATDTVVLGPAVGFNYLALWRSDADGGDPSEVHIAGGGNARNTFGPAVDRTIGGVPGKLIVSVTRQNASLLGGENVRLV